MLLPTLFTTGLALAPPSGPAGGLRWEAPADRCPSEVEVASRLAALVGEGELNVEADARVSPTASGWALDLRIHWGDAGERRHLEAESCDELAEAALVLLSVLAEEGRVAAVSAVESGSGQAEPPRPEPPQPEPPQPELLAPAEVSEPVEAESLEANEPVEAIALDRGSTGAGLAPPPTRRRPAKRRALALMTGALADIGGLARPSFGVRLGVVGWLGRRLRLVAEGRYLPPRPTGSDASYARAGRIQLGYAHLGACLNLARGRVEVPICGALEVGSLRAAGFGEEADQGARDLWLAAAANTSLAVAVAPKLALVVGVEIVAPIARQRYIYGPEILYETALPGGRALFGLEFRFADQIGREAENPRERP